MCLWHAFCASSQIARARLGALKKGRTYFFNVPLYHVVPSDSDEAADATSHSSSSRTVYRSCPRTVNDEEFLMVRFQVFCFLTGAIAFMSVRKQKAAAASLFDQRKLNLQKRRSSDQMATTTTSSSTIIGGNVEMTSMTQTSSAASASMIRQEETKALLVSSSDNDGGLDIV